MSEAELQVIKARLRGSILNKVRRVEYRCVLPAGFVYGEAANVVLDPDSQIRETTIACFFETFSRVQSACQTVKVFRTRPSLPLPASQQHSDDFRAADRNEGYPHVEQPALCGRLRLWPAALPTSC
jgi:hypothetical protein